MADPSSGNVNGGVPPIVGTGRCPCYPTYKDSGIEWLGEIPAHWEVKRTRRAARLESGHTPSRNNSEYWQDCNIPWFTLADVWQIREGGKDVVTETKEKISEMGLAHSAARLLPKGTVILSRTASVGFSAIAGVDMATTQDYVNWVCTSALRPEYLLLVFRSMKSEFQRLTMGSTHLTIYMPDVWSFTVPLPPIEEQARIVAFVRVESAKIDALVAKKERLIELLQEKRTSLIACAVTKGLDSGVAMEDSGIEWLGEIPAHWAIKRLKRWTSLIQTGSTPPTSNVQYFLDGTVPWHGPSSFSSALFLRPASRMIAESALRERVARIFGKECSMIVTIGATTGRVGFIDEPSSCNQQITAVEFDSANMFAKYAGYQLKRFEPVLSGIAPSTTLPILSREQVGYLPFCGPPMSEQRDITSYLDRETAKIDALVAKVREAIERLKELRTALISAAVTGKIDVREASG